MTVATLEQRPAGLVEPSPLLSVIGLEPFGLSLLNPRLWLRLVLEYMFRHLVYTCVLLSNLVRTKEVAYHMSR